MKKIVLISSHYYSGSSQLYEAMDANPRIQGFKSGEPESYASAQDFVALTQKRHKVLNSAAVYMDEILQNYQISTVSAYEHCKFVYVVRQPGPVIDWMFAKMRIKPDYASRYYMFRLRRICEMAKRTPGAVLLTFDDLRDGRGADLLQDYLCLKHPIEWESSNLAPVRMKLNPAPLSPEALESAEEDYERYLYFLRNQALRRPL